MRTAIFLRSYLLTAAIIIAPLVITIWYAMSRGQDFNWDQRNYHIGVPYLLEHGTFWDSIAPAGIQSYLNPYVLQIQFFCIMHLSPSLFVFVLAVVQSISFMFAGVSCVEVARSSGMRVDTLETTLLALLGFALCLMVPMVLSESGTTFTDFLLAVPIIGAYTLLLIRDRIGPMVAATLAGILIGAATALKLTNGVFAFGVIGFAFAGPERPSQRFRWLILCGSSALLAFLAVGGSWQLELWKRFHNPFFPYYNNIFHSPDFGATAFHDERFLPHSVLDIWRYPLYWLLGGSPTSGTGSPSSEFPFADARWVVMVFGGTAFLTALMMWPSYRKQRLAEPATGLFFAVVISYLVWLAAFGIHRYMAPIDILCGAAVLVLAIQIPWPLPRLSVLAAVAIGSFTVIRVPDWAHLPWQPHWQAINRSPLDLGGPAIVFLSGKPSLYIAASLPADARYVGISGEFNMRADADTTFSRQLTRELSSTPGASLKEVDQGSVPDVASDMLASYGLAVTPKCKKLSVADEVFRVCDVDRTQ